MNNVLYASNSNYFKYMITSIYSLLENNKNIPIAIHILEDNFTSEQKKKLSFLLEQYGVEYKLYPMDIVREYLDMFNIPLWRGTEIANARLFANEIVDDVDRLLYLDSDTIVTNKIDELFKMQLEYPVSAVKELEVSTYLPKDILQYYNSGVLLYDFKRWDEENCVEKLYREIDVCRDFIRFPDQDLLNLALYDSIGELPYKFNVTPNLMEICNHKYLSRKAYRSLDDNTFDKIINDLENPCIYHMTKYLTVRPWEKNNFYPFNNIFDEYYKKMYPDYMKEKTNFFIGSFSKLPEINLVRKALTPKELRLSSTKIIKKVLNRDSL